MATNRILAFDPAAETEVSHTGFAVIEVTDEDLPPVVDQSGTIPGGYQGFMDWAHACADYERVWLPGKEDQFGTMYNDAFPDTVVCEKFVKYRLAADPSPLLIEGVIRYLWPNVQLQRSNEKAIITDELLRKHGFWSSEGHHKDANAAIAHGLAYLVKSRHKGTLALL